MSRKRMGRPPKNARKRYKQKQTYADRPEQIKANAIRYYYEHKKDVLMKLKRKNIEKTRVKRTRQMHMYDILKKGRAYKHQTIMVDKEGNAYYSRIIVAKRVKMPYNTLDTWEKRKVVPPTIYRNEDGFRMYSEHQVKLIKKAYKRIKTKDKRKKWNTEKASKYMYKRWKEEIENSQST